MNRFVKQLILFILAGLVYFLVNLCINKIIFLCTKPHLSDSNIIILGDSHPQTINPEFFASAQNICQGGEPIIISYWKLQYVFKKIKFDTLIMGFSYQNISESADLRTELFNRIYQIQQFKDIKHLNINHYQNFMVFFRNMCLFPKVKHNTFIGNYQAMDSNFTNDIQTKIKEHFYKNKNIPLSISKTSISYMDSIITLCSNNNKTLILVGTPLHKNYYSSVPSHYKLKYELLYKKYVDENILFFNYNNLNYEDECFYNADHLNLKGSQNFTLYFKDVLKTVKN